MDKLFEFDCLGTTNLDCHLHWDTKTGGVMECPLVNECRNYRRKMINV